MRVSHVVIGALLASGVTGTAAAQSSYWMAAGFIGSSFNTGADRDGDVGSSLNFGGELGYLWRGVLGAEFLADFAPAFGLTSAPLENDPNVSTYMANVIGTLPLGNDGRFQPYGSAGLGGIHLGTEVVSQTTGSTTSASEMKLGWNAGGGLMAFSGGFGVRGDLRYYRAGAYDALSGTAGGQLTQRLLSELDFWRFTAGAVFRW